MFSLPCSLHICMICIYHARALSTIGNGVLSYWKLLHTLYCCYVYKRVLRHIRIYCCSRKRNTNVKAFLQWSLIHVNMPLFLKNHSNSPGIYCFPEVCLTARTIIIITERENNTFKKNKSS